MSDAIIEVMTDALLQAVIAIKAAAMKAAKAVAAAPPAAEGGAPSHAVSGYYAARAYVLMLACINGVLVVPLIPVLMALKAESEAPKVAAAAKEVREALKALEAISEAAKTAASAPPAADEGGASSSTALSLACICCLRLPSDMDDEREKHPICGMCRDQKLPTTYLCGEDCPANPGAWQLHGVFHKKVRKQRKMHEDGGARQQLNREIAERNAQYAAQTGDEYDELLAEGTRFLSKQDWRRAAKANREAIALRPDDPAAYYNLGLVLSISGHKVEAVQRLLDSKERREVGSEGWAVATANAFNELRMMECAEVAKPEWWNDEGLKALSARVVRAAPNDVVANVMRALVLGGLSYGAWEVGPRSAAELKEAAALFRRSAALCDAPAWKAESSRLAGRCRAAALCSAPMRLLWHTSAHRRASFLCEPPRKAADMRLLDVASVLLDAALAAAVVEQLYVIYTVLLLLAALYV